MQYLPFQSMRSHSFSACCQMLSGLSKPLQQLQGWPCADSKLQCIPDPVICGKACQNITDGGKKQATAFKSVVSSGSHDCTAMLSSDIRMACLPASLVLLRIVP